LLPSHSGEPTALPPRTRTTLREEAAVA
jgi:hypothetical protein